MRIETTDITDPESFADFYHELAISSPFRILSGKELEAVTLMDNRDITKPNNKIFITAPHASKDVKYSKLEFYDRVAVNTQIGYDIGAFEIASGLSESLKCIGITSNVSKLIIDYNKSLTSRHLIPSIIPHNEAIDAENKEPIKISFNKRVRVYDRVMLYYLEYHKLVKEIIEFLNPKYHIDIHTYEMLHDHDPEEYKRT